MEAIPMLSPNCYIVISAISLIIISFLINLYMILKSNKSINLIITSAIFLIFGIALILCSYTNPITSYTFQDFIYYTIRLARPITKITIC